MNRHSKEKRLVQPALGEPYKLGSVSTMKIRRDGIFFDRFENTISFYWRLGKNYAYASFGISGLTKGNFTIDECLPGLNEEQTKDALVFEHMRLIRQAERYAAHLLPLILSHENADG